MQKRILIVDDEPGLTYLLAENLADLGPGYEIETCNSGVQALALNKARPFDIVIADLMMPGMNGFQLIQLLTQQHPQIKLVLMTAYGNEMTAIKAQQLGVSHYMTKPFPLEEIIAAVQAALKGNL